MSNHSDSMLLEIVTKLKDGYQLEAIDAANKEIEKRNLSVEEISVAKEEIKDREVSQGELENEPLGSKQRFLFFICFWGIIPWAMAGTYKANGSIQKYKDAWRFMRYGFLTMVSFIVLTVVVLYLTR